MSEPKRWRGIMALGEEMRKFCEGETTQCDRSQPGEKVWLSFTKEGWEQRADVGGGIYRVEFVGRKTIFPGSFGHLSGYDAEIVVDRLVSIKKLPGGEDPELLAVKARRD